MPLSQKTFSQSVGPLILGVASSAFAHDPSRAPAPERPQLQLSAEAAVNVATDELTVTMAFEKDGPVAASLNAEVLRQLNDALALAKKSPRVEARLSSVHTNPNWGQQGKRNGWKVRGELVLTSKDVPTLSTLAGKLSESLQLTGVSYGVSRERQAEVRQNLIDDAAAALKSKAQATAKALGYAGYEVSSLNLSDGLHQQQPPAMYRGRVEAMAMSVDTATLPSEGGTQRLSVTFSGSVFLRR